MYKYVSLVFLWVASTFVMAEVKVTSVVTRSDRLTSTLISCEYTVETPVGTTVKFPETIEQDGIAFISHTFFPVTLGTDHQLVSKVTYTLTIPKAGKYQLVWPDLLVNTGDELVSQSLPSCKIEVLSRLPKGGVVSLPFIGKIEVNPQHHSQGVWLIMAIMGVISLVGYFILKRGWKKNQPTVLSKLRLLEAHHELTPPLLRALLLESIGLEGSSCSNSELNAMILTENESSFDPERLILLMNQLNESSFSREGVLSEEVVNQAIAFIKQNQVEEN